MANELVVIECYTFGNYRGNHLSNGNFQQAKGGRETVLTICETVTIRKKKKKQHYGFVVFKEKN